jgi:hypothetical protein
MSTLGVSGVASVGEGDCGNEGTNGFGAAAGTVGEGRVGFIGALAGDNWDKVIVVEYKRETTIANVKDKI